jgi:signal transduction histidine kinase
VIGTDPLRTVELLALVDEASASLRHDVRNRIASVRNLAFFVRRKLSAEENPNRDPRVAEFLGKIEGEVQRTDEVIDAWSALVQRTRPSEPCPVSVVDCVRIAIEASRLPPSVSPELAVEDEAWVDADLHVLAFAVRCLIENAGEAIGSGSVSVRALRAGHECSIVVSDQGSGIADRARCLERFESTKPGHLGLGLCMAQRIAARLGGELVIGAPAIGAEVSLRLPIAGARSEPGTAP